MNSENRLARLYEEIHACNKCHNVESSLCTRKVIPDSEKANLALMAQAPSEGGVRKSGVHWIDENGNLKKGSGTFLNKHLKTIGYSVDPKDKEYIRPYTTNVLHCWTGRNGKRDRTPSKTELESCKSWWIKEFQTIQPISLLLFGKPASESFVKISRIEGKFSDLLNEQGRKLSFDKLSLNLFFLPHPASSYKNKGKLYEKVFKLIKNSFQ